MDDSALDYIDKKTMTVGIRRKKVHLEERDDGFTLAHFRHFGESFA